jgi:hypothetical protein
MRFNISANFESAISWERGDDRLRKKGATEGDCGSVDESFSRSTETGMTLPRPVGSSKKDGRTKEILQENAP